MHAGSSPVVDREPDLGLTHRGLVCDHSQALAKVLTEVVGSSQSSPLSSRHRRPASPLRPLSTGWRVCATRTMPIERDRPEGLGGDPVSPSPNPPLLVKKAGVPRRPCSSQRQPPFPIFTMASWGAEPTAPHTPFWSPTNLLREWLTHSSSIDGRCAVARC